MGAWNALSSIITVLSGAGVVLLAAGCVWPSDNTPSPDQSPQRVRINSAPDLFTWPAQWSCADPDQPFTLIEAHTWMQIHRDHVCPRKQAAFAALIAAGRIHPDSSRRNPLRSAHDD